MKRIHLIIALCLTGTLLFNCGWSHMARGGTIGAGIGGVVGGLIGYKAGNTAVGAIIGSAVGGASGMAIGRYMDKQAAEIKRDLKGAKVERVGEGIKITFQSGILFKVNSSVLLPEANANVTDLARILLKYKDTDILVEGHTDSTGAALYNQNLSENRGNSVSNQLKSQGVQQSRISVMGYGEDQPLDDNGTEIGRKNNRRVEIAIFANNKLKKAAKNGTI
jgi:outer membrane protein OmpA-like peptidoglycan-associated protein